jgi:2',3'-cyclic-nucleotide 2'-phosphodiesterase (5'-nucleotidase family)
MKMGVLTVRTKSFSSFLFRNLLVFVLIISIISVGSFCFAADGRDTGLADATRITIIHTNDTHARVKEGEGIGFAKISGLIREIEKESPNVLVLDAGDTLHGQAIATLSRGESIVRLMNAVGYAAMAPGNHDFNYGYERLAELAELADYPILAANVVKEDGSRLLDPYAIIEIAGLRVGIIGLATSDTTFKTHPDNVKGLSFKDPIEAAQQAVEALKDETDIIIALAHLGMDQSSTVTSIDVAEAVDGIDLIVDGHSHTVLEKGQKAGNALIVSTGEYGKNLGVVDIYFREGKIADIDARLIGMEAAAKVSEDEAIVSLLDSIENEQTEILNDVVGRTEVALEGAREKVRTGETNLGNLITDAMVYITGADCAITNGGGIRTSIDEGDITRGEILSVLPFDNYIIAQKVTGADIKEALEHGTSSWSEPVGGFPHVSGIKFVIDTGREVGDRVVSITVNGEPLDPGREYVLVTNDYLAAGGDGYTMLVDRPVINEYGAMDEAVAAYIQAKGTVAPVVEGRITVQETKPEPEYYIVQPGDWLMKIARKLSTTWRKLQELNKIKNPDLIYPGQKIILPE